MSRRRNPPTFREAFTDKFVADKFGEATTHWRKLEDRVHRGVGNPCPLVLIGLPDAIVTFHEGKERLRRRLIKLLSAGWVPPSVFRLGAVPLSRRRASGRARPRS
jgi:hypothetical protein